MYTLKVADSNYSVTYILSVHRGVQKIYAEAFNGMEVKDHMSLFYKNIALIESIPFKDLPLYINHKYPLIRVLCLDRLKEG